MKKCEYCGGKLVRFILPDVIHVNKNDEPKNMPYTTGHRCSKCGRVDKETASRTPKLSDLQNKRGEKE